MLPFLFVIVMEALSRLLSKLVYGEYLSGFSVGERMIALVMVSHLLFADGTLILCANDLEQLGHWKCVLLCFKVGSGLK